jgi:hypothetical protein
MPSAARNPPSTRDGSAPALVAVAGEHGEVRTPYAGPRLDADLVVDPLADLLVVPQGVGRASVEGQQLDQARLQRLVQRMLLGQRGHPRDRRTRPARRDGRLGERYGGTAYGVLRLAYEGTGPVDGDQVGEDRPAPQCQRRVQ